MLTLITNVLESLENLNINAEKQSDIIEKLNNIDDENRMISEDLTHLMNLNNEKLSKLNSLSNEIRNSAIEG